MEIEIREHEGKELTGAEMAKIISGYWSDLGASLSLPFDFWFDRVKSIPYETDDSRVGGGRVVELVPRPAYLLDPKIFPRIDCKKKTVLVCSWAKGRGLPFRMLAVSYDPDKRVSHVFPQIDFGGGWVNCDATYPEFYIGMSQSITFAAELGT